MKTYFENWRHFLAEADNTRSFTFSPEEIKALNKSIAKIVASAKKILGADGPVTMLSPKNMEKVELDPRQRDPAPLQKVAEEKDEDELNPPEVVQLRQKWHGPEGELNQRGPKGVKNLPKGLGRMTAPEFEESGFVMKVSEDVLLAFEEMVEATKQTGDLFTQARDWYHNIRGLLDQETNDDRDSALLGLLIATYSPRAKFALNLAEAAFMFKAVKEDAARNPELLRQYLETFPGADSKEPGASRGFTNASKVPNFSLNLIAPELAGKRDPETGEMTYNDMYMWNSTIDTWMIDAFYPALKRSSTAGEWEASKGKLMSNVVSYRYMAQLVAQEAKKFGLLPHELQAIIWVSMQIRQTGDASLGVTTEFAINQIKDAIKNIRMINTDLEDIRREFEEKSWLGILFDEIDSKGFEEASKFVLGIKDEKGKIVSPGIRSITASGKKGTAFDYYKPPPTTKEPAPDGRGRRAKAASEPKGPPAPKPIDKHADESSEFAGLDTFYVMNKIVQMPTGKFNNLYDSITLYLDPAFSTQKAVDYILGRFDPDATATKDYFTEGLRIKIGK